MTLRYCRIRLGRRQLRRAVALGGVVPVWPIPCLGGAAWHHGPHTANELLRHEHHRRNRRPRNSSFVASMLYRAPGSQDAMGTLTCVEPRAAPRPPRKMDGSSEHSGDDIPTLFPRHSPFYCDTAAVIGTPFSDQWNCPTRSGPRPAAHIHGFRQRVYFPSPAVA